MPADPAARLPVLDRRRAGVLLHLSALGPGALGEPAHRFVDWLASAGFSVWQILPVGPTGADGSPYWVSSDCAGNADFVDPSRLPAPHGPQWQAFLAATADWLDDYALYAVLRAQHGGAPWQQWPAALRDRDSLALRRAHEAHEAAIQAVRRAQFAFHQQWRALREHAHARGVRLFGDVPIYVAPDSVETWAHREQFRLDAAGRPTLVAGVPPDYFAEDGQLWGNPLYDWAQMTRDGFAHWRRRLRHQLERFDLVRIDHFRGLESHWAVPVGAATAREGSWLPTPGDALLEALRRDAPDLPVVAEDLGEITPEVDALRRRFALPGMHVLQFAFDGNPDNPHLPHRHAPDGVVYTGTHDNDTLRGWLGGLDPEALQRVEFYLRAPQSEVPTALHRAALGSVARLAVLPMQDLLELGSAARFNTPGTTTGNWSWLLPARSLDPGRAEWFARLNHVFGRG
jgi:4-alpha-glucanotransferase